MATRSHQWHGSIEDLYSQCLNQRSIPATGVNHIVNHPSAFIIKPKSGITDSVDLPNIQAALQAKVAPLIDGDTRQSHPKGTWKILPSPTSSHFSELMGLLSTGHIHLQFPALNASTLVEVDVCFQRAPIAPLQLLLRQVPLDISSIGLPERILTMAGYTVTMPGPGLQSIQPPPSGSVSVLRYFKGLDKETKRRDDSCICVEVLPPKDDPYLRYLPPRLVLGNGDMDLFTHVHRDPYPRVDRRLFLRSSPPGACLLPDYLHFGEFRCDAEDMEVDEVPGDPADRRISPGLGTFEATNAMPTSSTQPGPPAGVTDAAPAPASSRACAPNPAVVAPPTAGGIDISSITSSPRDMGDGEDVFSLAMPPVLLVSPPCVVVTPPSMPHNDFPLPVTAFLSAQNATYASHISGTASVAAADNAVLGEAAHLPPPPPPPSATPPPPSRLRAPSPSGLPPISATSASAAPAVQPGLATLGPADRSLSWRHSGQTGQPGDIVLVRRTFGPVLCRIVEVYTNSNSGYFQPVNALHVDTPAGAFYADWDNVHVPRAQSLPTATAAATATASTVAAVAAPPPPDGPAGTISSVTV